MTNIELAANILVLVGGAGNIRQVTHCATRLRFELVTPALAQPAALAELPGVLQALQAGGQFQVVIGPQVGQVYQALQDLRAPGVVTEPATTTERWNEATTGKNSATGNSSTTTGTSQVADVVSAQGAAGTADMGVQGTTGTTGLGAQDASVATGFNAQAGQATATAKTAGHTSTEGQQTKGPRWHWLNEVISVISTTFTPMIPVFTGAGLIKALLTILTLTNVLSNQSQTFMILNALADAAFYFMPVLLAYGAALKFAVSPILAMTLAAMLVHPDIVQLFASGKPVHFLGLPVLAVTYAGSVLPIIITVWLMAYLDRFLTKKLPATAAFFLQPLLLLLVMGPLTLLVIGPIGAVLNDGLAAGANWCQERVSWLIPTLMGGLQPFLIITGTAWALTPIATTQLSRTGSEMVNGPGMLASNIAQAGSTLAIAAATKDTKLRQLASSTGITALLGITEPSLYGVTLKMKQPLIFAMIGGAVGGLYAGLSGLVRYAFVSPGLAALPAFVGANPWNIVHAVITVLISFGVSFALTYVWEKRRQVA